MIRGACLHINSDSDQRLVTATDGREDHFIDAEILLQCQPQTYTQGETMIHRTALAFAILALASATTFSARAETAEERQACTPDAQNFCADEIPDRERVYECLVRKVNQLSPACKKIINASIAPSKSKR